jgi:hypothetical protein
LRTCDSYEKEEISRIPDKKDRLRRRAPFVFYHPPRQSTKPSEEKRLYGTELDEEPVDSMEDELEMMRKLRMEGILFPAAATLRRSLIYTFNGKLLRTRYGHCPF